MTFIPLKLNPVNLQNMYSQPIGLVSAGILQPKATNYTHMSIPIRNPSIQLNFTRRFGKRSHCFHRTFASVRKPIYWPSDGYLKALPTMTFEDFQKSMKSDKIMRLFVDNEELRHFIVELKEIPGDKSLQRTMFMKLEENQAQQAIKEYKEHRFKIKTLNSLLLPLNIGIWLFQYVISHAVTAVKAVTAFFPEVANGKSDMLKFRACYNTISVKFLLPLSSTLAEIKSRVSHSLYFGEEENEAYNLYYKEVRGGVLLIEECDWEDLKEDHGHEQGVCGISEARSQDAMAS